MRARLKALCLYAALLLAPTAAQGQSPALMGAYGQALQLYQAGRHAEAVPHYERVVAMAEAEFGADHPELALDLNNLAELYRLLGRLEEAERLLERSVAIEERASGDGSPAFAVGLNNLGLVRHARGRSGEAEALHKRALALLERAYGPSHPDIARSLGNLAALYRDTGEVERARPLYERALAIGAETLGASHPTTAALRAQLAALNGAAAAADGPFAAHIASVAEASAVEPEWQRLERQLAGLLEGQSLAPQAVDLGERGVFHRVRAGPLAGRAEAEALCARLHARDQYCVVMPY